VTDSERLDSLDLFRGMTIAAMILVSTPGTWEAVYYPLDHAVWHGWTLTDLVFPFLLFAMGAAVSPALARRRDTPGTIRRRVVTRVVVLFVLGLVFNVVQSNPPISWPTFPIFGVLQRIAIVYGVVAMLVHLTSLRTQMAIATASLLGYWAVMTLVPVPGVGSGVLTPDGNLASFVDRAVLGRHLAHGTWESEGLLSTVPAIATALFGIFSVRWLLRSRQSGRRIVILWLSGLAATVAGLAWGRLFPINKNLWTSSFALFTSGLAIQLLALCSWALDGVRWRSWATPFLAFGRNALTAYLLSLSLDRLLTRWIVNRGSGASMKGSLYAHTFAWWAVPCCGAEAASLMYAVAYVAVWGLVVTLMYRRKIFIRI
jgi:predicted acyltransferase